MGRLIVTWLQVFRLLLSLVVFVCVGYQIFWGIQCGASVGLSEIPSIVFPNVTTEQAIDEHFPVHQKVLLRDLVGTVSDTSCPGSLVSIGNKVESEEETSRERRRVPRIIHVTGKSRCVTTGVATNLEKWKIENYSFYYHDDAAMDRMLNRHWPEFPHLRQAMHCSISGAARADVWRALILWEYGGVYTDMDNAPGPLFNSSAIESNDESFFLVEGEGYLSQYFMATRPRHPLMFFLVQSALHRLLDQYDVENQYVPFVTGPGALKTAFIHYMQAQGQKLPRESKTRTSPPDKYASYELVRAGLYKGWKNSTVRIVGSRTTSDRDWVLRNVIYKKKRVYREMNMTHFGAIRRRVSNTSCWQHILEREGY